MVYARTYTIIGLIFISLQLNPFAMVALIYFFKNGQLPIGRPFPIFAIITLLWAIMIGLGLVTLGLALLISPDFRTNIVKDSKGNITSSTIPGYIIAIAVVVCFIAAPIISTLDQWFAKEIFMFHRWYLLNEKKIKEGGIVRPIPVEPEPLPPNAVLNTEQTPLNSDVTQMNGAKAVNGNGMMTDRETNFPPGPLIVPPP